MMRWIVLVSFLVFSACNTAGPGFGGAEAVRLSEGGDRFVMRFRAGHVEAIRVNPRALPIFPTVARNAGLAAQRHFGCRVAWAVGDPSVVRLGLACAGRSAPPKPKSRPSVTCDVSDAYYNETAGRREATLRCVPD